MRGIIPAFFMCILWKNKKNAIKSPAKSIFMLELRISKEKKTIFLKKKLYDKINNYGLFYIL